MANINAKDVAELRRQTGCGMMDCKNALVEANGDFDAAIKILREKGMAATAKKASRIAAEGIVATKTNGTTTAMIEVNSETDFVAKNASFREFVDGLLDSILANNPADVEALMACSFGDGKTVEEALQEKTYTIGEKLSIRRFCTLDGTVATYIHDNGVIGVMVKFQVSAGLETNPEFLVCANSVAMQVAAYNAPYVSKETVPASVIEEEKGIILTQMKNDPKMANKPEKVLEGIVTGKLNKYFEANCLLSQEFFLDDSKRVGEYVAGVAKQLGGEISVVEFRYYKKGEGIEKRSDDLAAEVAKLMGGN